MKTYDFSYLLENEFFVSNVISHYHSWNPGSIWNTPASGRNNNALMFFLNCKIEYFTNNSTVAKASSGNISYLPRDIIYSCRFYESDKTDYYALDNLVDVENYYVDGTPNTLTSKKQKHLFNAIFVGFNIYNADFEEINLSDKILVIDCLDNNILLKMFLEIVSLSKIGHGSPVKLNSLMYQMLFHIAETLQKAKNISNEHSVLEPAFVYLSHNNICDVSVSTLAEVCGISSSGFRRIFKSIVGIPPIEYIMKLKAEKARDLLLYSDMSVSEVSDYLNFNNIGYFSRFYKKSFGFSPSKDRRHCLKE